jgi:formamidopyrimidine-DNA glycosylase
LPELPEVETVVRGLARGIVGHKITAVKILHKPSVSGSPKKPQTAVGRTIERVFRRGKFIRIGLSGGYGMAVHLRMTGWLGMITPAAFKTRVDAYARVLFMLENGDAILFHDVRTFGRVWVGTEEELLALKALSKLGPEPLEIDADEFTKRLRARNVSLKSLLLNQEFLAGVGNIYADEALYAAGLHPLMKSAKVRPEKARALHGAIQKVLQAAIKAGGTSIENFRNTDGDPGWFQRELLAYGRGGEECSRCGKAMKRILVGQRSTCFCPGCQKKRGS